MPDINSLQQQINQLATLVNTLVSQSKTHLELPDSTAGNKTIAAYNSTSGDVEKFDLSGLISSVNDSQTKIVTLGDITRVDNTFTYGAGFEWLINGVENTNASDIDITIGDATAGNYRIDIVVLDGDNNIRKIIGFENASVAVAPEVEPDTILLQTFFVYEGEVTSGNPSPTGDKFVTKVSYEHNTIGEGVNVDNVAQNGKTKFVLLGDNVIKGMAGSFTGMSTDMTYVGQLYFFTNYGTQPSTLKHDDADGEIKFNFPNGIDYVLRPKQTVALQMSKITTLKLDFIGNEADNDFLVFEGLIDQTGTGNPSATPLNPSAPNLLSGIVWTRTGAGSYIGTKTGAFPEHKVFALAGSGATPEAHITIGRISDNELGLYSYNIATDTYEDSFLVDTALLIKVKQI